MASLALISTIAIGGAVGLSAKVAGATVWAKSSLVTGLNGPSGVAVDSSGDIYVAELGDDSVEKLTPSGSGYTKSTIATGLNDPSDVAVDSLGRLYVTEEGNGNVDEFTPDGSGYTESLVVVTSNPYRVAVDASGDLFVLVEDDVVKFTPSGSSYIASSVGSEVLEPTGVAVDGAGHVYVSSPLGIYKFTPSGSGYTEKVVTDWLVDGPTGVAADSSGNLFVPFGNGGIDEFIPDGSGYAESSVVKGLNDPAGVAISGTGNLYVAEDGNGNLDELTVLFQISTASLPAARPGHSYAPVQLKAQGLGISSHPYKTTLAWSQQAVARPATALPAGMRLSSAGVLAGTPSQSLHAEKTTIKVQVTETVTTITDSKKVVSKKTVKASIPLTIA